MSEQTLSWLEQHAYDLRNAIAATDESITGDDQILAQPGRMKQRIDRLESALKACSAQMLTETERGARETCIKIRGSASHWEDFMSPAWIEAQRVLKT